MLIFIADYLVIDVTNVIAKGRKARVRFQTDTAQIVIIVKQKTEEELCKFFLNYFDFQNRVTLEILCLKIAITVIP